LGEDRKVRDRAIQSLIAFLSRGAGDSDDTAEGSSGYVRLSDGEMAKLWKGLFYCTYTHASQHPELMEDRLLDVG